MLQTRPFRSRTAAWLAAALTAVTACGGGDGGGSKPPTEPPPAGSTPSAAYRGTLTLARDAATGSVFSPEEVVDLDLASGNVTVRFTGIDPHRTNTGETAYLARLEAGHIADRGVVVADARGVTGAPLYVCKDYSPLSNVICHTPRLSPNKQLVAFGTAGDGGSVCKNNYDLYWADYVIVRDRGGAEVARFEGFSYPEWLPDGRLLALGSQCRNAGVWVSDAALRTLTRIDGNQIGTPAALPAVSPDGRWVALVLNKQLWALSLDGRGELKQLTEGEYSIGAAAWSPDGSAFAVTLWGVNLPLKAVALFRPDDEKSVVVKQLPFLPFGPLSWH